MMESLLCNEVWLMSPSNSFNVQENDECNAKGHAFSTKQDSEEALAVFLRKEAKYVPGRGYSKFVNTNDVILNARSKAVSWLIKSGRRMNLCTGTVFLAANYMDRFISLTRCKDWKFWMFELLCVACLSIASKFNETTSHTLHEFQVEGVDNCFAPTLIQRMELTVLKALGWKMDSTTPFSYVHFLIQSADVSDKTLVDDLNKRATELLLTALLDPELLEFRQCVMAISAVRCVFDDLFPSANTASLIAHLDIFIPQDQTDDSIKCQRIMTKLLAQDHKMLEYGKSYWHGPSSPVTVLMKVEWFNICNRPVDQSFIRTSEMNVDLRSGRKRKRDEELECESCEIEIMSHN